MSANPQRIRLSQLSLKIKEVLDNSFRAVSFWVMADITNHLFKSATNYHYFELVEKDTATNNILAKFSTKSWGSGAQKIKNFEEITGQKFSNNIQVLVNVIIEFHPMYGLQLQVMDIDPNFTLGMIEKQRRENIRLLLAQNPTFIGFENGLYWTKNKRLKLPVVIQHIAVISSGSSAGLEDFKHTLGKNEHGFKFKVDDYFTQVQGDNHADKMRQKLIDVFTSGIQYDVVVITRGGGSDTDFLIFDNYSVGQAIAKFPIPIITGIGHQKNTTIADLMAHTSTNAPTKTAEFIIAHNKRFEELLVQFQQKIVIKAQQLLSDRNKKLNDVNSRIKEEARTVISMNKDLLVKYNQVITGQTKTVLFNKKSLLQSISQKICTKPVIMVSQQLSEVENLDKNIQSYTKMYLKNAKGYLGHLEKIIKMSRPEKILEMGFAMVKHKGKLVSSASKIDLNDDVTIVMKDAEMTATIKTKK